MTRILVQRGSAGSSSNRASSLPAGSSSSNSNPPFTPVASTGVVKEEEQEKEVQFQDLCVLDELGESSGSGNDKFQKNDVILLENVPGSSRNVTVSDDEKGGIEEMSVMGEKGTTDSDLNSDVVTRELTALRIPERSSDVDENVSSGAIGSSEIVQGGCSYPPPPPVPPPKPFLNLGSRRIISRGSTPVGIGGGSRRQGWPVVLTRTSSSGSRPSSPRSHGEGEGYNSADEQGPCFESSYDDVEKERQFEHDIRRTKGLEVKRMLEDGNCLFRAVADQVYGDTEVYDLTRQMCIDYMERERDHFSQFITEGFTSYCKRKRRDKVYANNVEIQALSEMYNRPIHIYSYSTEPINIFHGNYNTDTPPIRLSYHHGNHYNSLVDPRRLAIGAGLGFSSLQGRNIDKDQVKAAIRAQQDQQIENALLAEGRFYSDLELTEKEIERMVMEASRAEYLEDDKFKQQVGFRKSSTTSGAEPSSSGTRPSRTDLKPESGTEAALPDTVVLSSSMQMLLSMGFSYLQVIEAYSIFGDDLDSMVCYLLEMGGDGAAANRRKGKATE